MGGFFGVVAYSLYNYRKKSASLKPSVYVIQTRVAAQGLVISILTLGLTYHMYQSYVHKNEPHVNALHRTIESATAAANKWTFVYHSICFINTYIGNMFDIYFIELKKKLFFSFIIKIKIKSIIIFLLNYSYIIQSSFIYF